jgi:hypothetical protein
MNMEVEKPKQVYVAYDDVEGEVVAVVTGDGQEDAEKRFRIYYPTDFTEGHEERIR